MPLILAPGDYVRWLSDEPDPHELMRPFPAEPDADVADLNAGQQAAENDELNWPRPPRNAPRLWRHVPKNKIVEQVTKLELLFGATWPARSALR